MIKEFLYSTILATTLLLNFNQVSKSQETISIAPEIECKEQIPFGMPLSKSTLTFLTICHKDAYITHLNVTYKIPDWVSYTLTPFDSIGCKSRSNKFAQDPLVSSSLQSSPKDYDHSGYDKGHIAPDSDMRFDTEIERESFFMSNMTPQLPSFNRGIWKKLETDVRNWAVFRNENLTIYGGPIILPIDTKTIGNNVKVPSGFYKIIIDDESHEAIAFEFDDQSTANNDKLEDHISTITNIEKLTDITFNVPSEVNKNIKSEMWTFQKGEYTNAKNKECKNNK